MDTSAQKIARKMANAGQGEGELALGKRLSLLRKTTGVDEYDLDQYEKTDIIRQQIQAVRDKANVANVTRQSPRKVYAGAKSKVGANIKTVNKANASALKTPKLSATAGTRSYVKFPGPS